MSLQQIGGAEEKMRKLISCILIVCLGPYLTGCEGFKDYTLTGHLWDTEATPDRHAPAGNANLSLYQDAARKDILVEYDEENNGSGVAKRRAYYLNANEKRVNAGKKPHFVRPNLAQGLDVIPVNPVGAATNGSIYAVFQPDRRQFVLWADGRQLNEYYLPLYPDWGDRWQRVALTPLTVTGDVAIYAAVTAAVLAVIYAWAWAQSGHTYRGG